MTNRLTMNRLSKLGKELLSFLFWGLHVGGHPTYRNLTEAPEFWEYRRRLRHQLARLEKRQLITQERDAEKIVLKLTATGRLAVLGGRDPEACWGRAWDGQWRMLLFDLPTGQAQVRIRLWRWLRANHFGYLQQSVWVTPHPLGELSSTLKDFQEDVESVVVMESRCAKGYPNHAIVRGAWDFELINRRYQDYLEVLGRRPRSKPAGASERSKLKRWLREEGAGWESAVQADPLLPRELWPKNYAGEHAWRSRNTALREAMRWLAV